MTLSPRERMLKVMNETLTEEARYHNWIYEAIRPITVARYWVEGKRRVSDCSKGCQAVARWAGDCPDPMGRNWDGYGNSTTMTMHLPHLNHLSEVQIADYVTFGYNGDDHATCVKKLIKDSLGHTVDLLLWSDGHMGAPNQYRLSYDKRQRYFLHNPVVKIPLTAAEILRAKTGFWAWAQWRKGVGHWKGHGKHNPKVRPNVPKVIPLRWWRRYAGIWGRSRKANKPTTNDIPSEPLDQ